MVGLLDTVCSQILHETMLPSIHVEITGYFYFEEPGQIVRMTLSTLTETALSSARIASLHVPIVPVPRDQAYPR